MISKTELTKAIIEHYEWLNGGYGSGNVRYFLTAEMEQWVIFNFLMEMNETLKDEELTNYLNNEAQRDEFKAFNSLI